MEEQAEYLTDAQEIVQNATSAESQCGIYFLIKSDEIVYVGQSINIPARIGQHKKDKDFDSVYTIDCERENLNEVESAYILKFRPKLNRSIPATKRHNGTRRKNKKNGIYKPWLESELLGLLSTIAARTLVDELKRRNIDYFDSSVSRGGGLAYGTAFISWFRYNRSHRTLKQSLSSDVVKFFAEWVDR